MNAATIAKGLGGRRAGAGWLACCPSHDDKNPSLSIREVNGKVLVHCHAGCPQHSVIAALRSRGLWPGIYTTACVIKHPGAHHPQEGLAQAIEAKRTRMALKVWRES